MQSKRQAGGTLLFVCDSAEVSPRRLYCFGGIVVQDIVQDSMLLHRRRSARNIGRSSNRIRDRFSLRYKIGMYPVSTLLTSRLACLHCHETSHDKDVASKQFLLELCVSFLQDVVQWRLACPDYFVFRHELFQHPLYLKYKAKAHRQKAANQKYFDDNIWRLRPSCHVSYSDLDLCFPHLAYVGVTSNFVYNILHDDTTKTIQPPW